MDLVKRHMFCPRALTFYHDYFWQLLKIITAVKAKFSLETRFENVPNVKFWLFCTQMNLGAIYKVRTLEKTRTA